MKTYNNNNNNNNNNNESDVNRIQDWTRYAYEITIMKRKKCTFGQAHAEVNEIRTRILNRQK